jgi:hypothetical protein
MIEGSGIISSRNASGNARILRCASRGGTAPCPQRPEERDAAEKQLRSQAGEEHEDAAEKDYQAEPCRPGVVA